jgi:protein-S-isoprenylcysteine O-methyltransferase Ste14
MMIRIGNFLFHYRNGLFVAPYLLIFLRGHAVFANYRLAALAGCGVAFAGQCLRAATIGLDYIRRGGKNRQVYADRLVQGGLFAHCRNPLYVGNFMILAGVGIASNSILFLGLGIPFFAFAYWAIIAAEENYLRNKFGKEFDDYCSRVNRLIPDFSGIKQTLAGMRFNWRQLITKEYGSAYLWVAAVILVTLKNAWLEGEYQAGRPLVWSLWILLGLATLAYGVARFLKKNGFFNTEVKSAS